MADRAEPPAPRRPWRRPWTLRVRLLAALLALAAAGLTVVGTASVLLLRHSLLTRVDQQLIGASTPWASGSAPTPPPNRGDRTEPPTNFRVAIIERNGAVDDILGQQAGDTGGPVLPTLSAATARQLGDRPFTVPDNAGGSDWRVLVLATPDDHVVAVALSLADTDAAVNQLLVIEIVAGVVVLGLLGAVATVVVRMGLRPLDRIEQTAGAIARGELDRRVSGADERTETGRLATALNTMLGRLGSALREQEHGQQRLRRFVADASHELRTPLTSIRGFAELYRRGGAPERSDVDNVMSRIEGEAGRMGRLVDDLLLLARLDEERALDLADVDLLVLAADAVADAQLRDPHRPVALSAPNGPQRVLGDEHRLRQVVTNLVTNALTHTPPGTPVRVTVDRQVGAAGPAPVAATGPPMDSLATAVIEVADEGSGVAAEQAPRLFDRFYRAEGTRSRNRLGSGLGLAIAAAIVEAHRGRIELVSAPGAGARFRVLLPLC